jgi:Zn-dependent M28 family amino/carboxypeptidase
MCFAARLVALSLAILVPGRTSAQATNADTTRVDIAAIVAMARELSSDSMRGRGPFTPENEQAARRLAEELSLLGARPVFGESLLVPFVAPANMDVTVFNVVGVLPARDGGIAGELVGITSHFDHLGVGKPDERGDSIYNGFLDAALPNAMLLDVARRYAAAPGDRPLVVMFMNLEEQGLVGSQLLVERPDAAPFLQRLKLLIGVDAGSPAGEAVEYQLMGAEPGHPGARVAEMLALARGWATTATAPRRISDVFVFSGKGVPIIFPIPGKVWAGYSEEQRAEAMTRFDHYHQPSDEWRPDFPMTGTATFVDWLWTIVRTASSRLTIL